MTSPTKLQLLPWPRRLAVTVERGCLEVGHRIVSVGFLVLIVGFGMRAAGKDAWLLFPIAFGCADLTLAAGVGAWTLAARGGTRKREAVGMICFSLAVLIPAAVMLVRIRNGA